MISTRPARRTFEFLSAVLLTATAAHATTLDWDAASWEPQGNTNRSVSYAAGRGSVAVTFTGNTAALDQAGAVISPAVNQHNTGGLSPAQDSLYVATNYSSAGLPFVTITLDFTGFYGGVSNLSFAVFDVDARSGHFVDELTVTALTPSGPVDPTSIVTSAANERVDANTVRGTASSPRPGSDGNVTFIFGDAESPVAGITQVTLTYRNTVGAPDPGFQSISIHDLAFDDPTADLSLTMAAAPAAAAVGDTVTLSLQVENAGPDAVSGVAVGARLPDGLTYLGDDSGGSYIPGTGAWTVGSVGAGASAQLAIDARVEPRGPWDYGAEITAALATDPDSTPANARPDEDDRANSRVTVPIAGLAKDIIQGPVHNGDGTYTLTYGFTVVNAGNTTLSSLQVTDDLGSAFATAVGYAVDSISSENFAINPGFDGVSDKNLLAGTDTLAPSASGVISVALTVAPGTVLGPYGNSASTTGQAARGIDARDVSIAGSDPDADGDGDPGTDEGPTFVTFPEAPRIGVAKAVARGPVDNGDGSRTLTYAISIENVGNVDLSNVRLTDDLGAAFAAATGFGVDAVTSVGFSVNPAYDGVTDTNLLLGIDVLPVTMGGTVAVTVTVTPGANPGPYDNTATATGRSPLGIVAEDVSTPGSDPDPDGDGDPSNDSSATPVTFAIGDAAEVPEADDPIER